MDVLRKPLTLNSSGRPVLLADEDEVELVLQDKVAIYIGCALRVAVRHRGGRVHR